MQHIHPKNSKQFKSAVAQAKRDGYQAVVPKLKSTFTSRSIEMLDDSPMAQWLRSMSMMHANPSASCEETPLDQPDGEQGKEPHHHKGEGDHGHHHHRVRVDGLRRGELMGDSPAMLDFSQAVVYPTPDNIGTPNAGYIPWGTWNDIPSQVFKLTSSQPTTAAALQYTADTATGLGVRLMYHIARWSGGTVTDEYIPYEKAGVYLRNRERELLAKLAALTAPSVSPEGLHSNGIVAGASAPASPSASTSASTPSTAPTAPAPTVPAATVPDGSPSGQYTASLIASYQKEYDALVNEVIPAWERTMAWWRAFKDDNNIDQHFQACMTDDAHLSMCFPTVIMNKGRWGKWDAQITGIGRLDPLITRFEQATRTENDAEYLSRYVYLCEAWRGDPSVVASMEMTAIPVTHPCHGLRHMREYVRANQRSKSADRQLEWCCPQYYPTMGKPYYSQPAWWSIFPSQVFQYACSLIFDKSIARKNGRMWGKILYVNRSYMQTLFDQMGADTEEKQDEILNGLYGQVEDFLKNPKKNGQLLIADSYMSADEKNLIDAIRIVDVPQPQNAQHKDDELEQIFSIIFFALGVHPALIGAEPGKKGNSGTFQRELHLLKTTQMAPRQRRMLYFYNSILSFNNLDENAVFMVKQATLTTLDNSKTGMVEEVKD